MCICLLCAASLGLWAQKVAVKTNLIYDATTTLNLGLEGRLAPRWTLDVSATWNPWTFADNRKWKQLLVQLEARYWFCEAFNGHFIGGHLLGGIYNMGNLNTNFTLFGTDFGNLRNYRYEGWMLGAGLVYGYQWLLARHWSIEAAIGLGYVYTETDKFECPTCGDRLETDKPRHYVGPTKVAVNLIYAF